jgi:hypothetical protein
MKGNFYTTEHTIISAAVLMIPQYGIPLLDAIHMGYLKMVFLLVQIIVFFKVWITGRP